MKYILTLIISSLLLSSTSFAQVKNQPQETIVSPEKRKQAEQVVIRAMRRFGRTLDFGDIYREMFIKDKKIRGDYESTSMEGFFDEKIIKKFDKPTQRKAFIASQNLFWLFLVYSFHTNSESSFDNLISSVEREISPTLNKRQRIIYKQLFNDGKDSTIETRREVLDRLFIFENTLKIIRKHFSFKFRQDLKNRLTANASFTHSDFATFRYAYSVVAKINGNIIPIEFIVVEESGVMRILSASFQSGT